jgi:ABC-type glycerol-3-phosphate transport system substrate-binding protein
MNRLLVLIVVLAAIAGAAFAGGDTEAAEEEQVTLRLLSRFTGTDATAPVWEETILLFEEMYPNVTVQDDSVNQEAAYNNKLQADLATGNLPNIFGRAGVVANVRLAENNVLMDVSPLMEDEEWFGGFIEGAFEVFNFEAYGVPGYYGVPYAIAPEVIVYNRELFAQAGAEIPETMADLYEVIDQLNAAGITPWAVGAQSTWRAGHIHNYLLYKWTGVPTAVQLGTRDKSWTDPDVVESLGFLQDLKARGAFWDNFEGIDYDMEKAMFFNGEAAMILNGSWFIGEVIAQPDPDVYGTFGFPYFEEKPEFRGHMVNFPQAFVLKEDAQGAERQAQIDFIKFWTGAERQTAMVEQIQRTPVRVDVDYDGIDLSHIFLGYMDILSEATFLGGDSFDYDPLPSMQDRTRNSIIGMLLGNTPEEAAAEIAAEVERN